MLEGSRISMSKFRKQWRIYSGSSVLVGILLSGCAGIDPEPLERPGANGGNQEDNAGVEYFGLSADDPPELTKAKKEFYEGFSKDDNFYHYFWLLDDFHDTLATLELPPGKSIPEPVDPGWYWDDFYEDWKTDSYEKPSGASVAWAGYECLWEKHILEFGIENPKEAEYGLKKLGEYYDSEVFRITMADESKSWVLGIYEKAQLGDFLPMQRDVSLNCL